MPSKRERQKADQIAKGTYVPTRSEQLESAIAPIVKLGATADEIRTLVWASVNAFRSGVAIHPSELDKMLERMSPTSS